MTRVLTASLSSTVLFLSYYGALNQSSLLSAFFDTTPQVTIIRSLLAVLLCLYCFSAWFRQPWSRTLMFMFSGLLVIFGVVGSFDSVTLGSYEYFASPLDILLALQLGVVSFILAAERPLATTRLDVKAASSVPKMSPRTNLQSTFKTT